MFRQSTFKPAWWIPGPHSQTLWPKLFPRRLKVLTRRERFELSDGDFVDLDWVDSPNKGPIVLILHGLGGSVESFYVQGMLKAIQERGWRGVVMNFRGCSGEPNRLPYSYHSGQTSDLSEVVTALHQRELNTPITAIGYSLGGNVLLKWLGETGEDNPLAAATAVSVPFELAKAAYRVQKGRSRFYQWYLLKSLREQLAEKLEKVILPIGVRNLSELRSCWEYDEYVTAPLHGFEDAHDYYRQASSRQYLKSIRVPTLVVHAKDDPFMTEDVVAREEELSDQLTFELSECGGHVGFISGRLPWQPEYWLEKRIPDYLSEILSK